MSLNIVSNVKKIGLVSSCLFAVALPAQAFDVSGNAGITSNYLWRGMTQNDNELAFSAGFDLEDESGFYAGVWGSSINFGDEADNEIDVYAGYAFEANGFSYDLGYIAYIYPDAGVKEYDFGEVYASVGYGPASISYSYQVADSADSYSTDTTYTSVGYELPVGETYSASLHYGYYDIEGAAEAQQDYGFTIGRGDFSLAVIGTSDVTADDDTKFVLSYGKSF